jgi:tape measure domain-containing protein
VATNLQVNAQTSQAVGAFNNLAAAIGNAQGAFNRLTTTLQQGSQAALAYGQNIQQGIGGAFQRLSGLANTLLNVLRNVAGGITLVFNSLLSELDKLQGFNAIMSVSTKSSAEAANSYTFLRKTADQLGVQFDALTGNYAKLVASIPDGTEKMNQANRAFLGVAMAARTLHASNSDTQLMFYAITQIASKGVVSMEELRRQLGEKLPGVIQIAAKALNTIPEELEKAIRKGIVISEKFLPIFGDALIRTFADSSEMASQSVSASINRLTNVWTDFVKEVLDSGAGTAIANVFDELRKKLSDPYVISRFADMIKNVADRVSTFIANLTSDDIRNGFDTFSKGVDMAITVITKLAELMTWVINNSGKFGAVIGAVGGAVIGGSVAGLPGAAIGGVLGAGSGAYAGYKMGSGLEDEVKRMEADLKARKLSEASKAQQENIKYQMMIPLLRNFVGLKSLSQVEGLMKPENLTQEMVSKLAGILGDKRFKTDADKASAAQWLAKTGQILSPDTARLSDVLGAGKPKTGNNRQDPLEATALRSAGLDANFLKEWGNLNTLMKQGEMSTEQLEKAQADLLAKQPFMEAAARADAKAMQDYNKEISTAIDQAIRIADARDDMYRHLQDQEDLAKMQGEDRSIEIQARQEINRLMDLGYKLQAGEGDLIREKLRNIQRINEVAAAGDNILSATVDKWRTQIIELQAMQKLMADPSSGFTQQNATDYIVMKDPNANGSDQWLEAQKRVSEEYYAYIDGLRQKDLISEKTAQMMKAKQALTYEQVRLGQASEFFGNLASLTESGNKRLAQIGKAAAIIQATIDGVLGVQKALASAPPPWNYALAAAVGVAAAVNVAKIRSAGFKSGGYTGNMGTNQVAGVVHGQEFVMNAQATRNNMPMLAAMNSGKSYGGDIYVDTKIDIKIDSEGGASAQSDVQSNAEFAETLRTQIEQVTLSVLLRETRPDGVLAK